MAQSQLEYDDGDDCPETIDGDDCGRSLTLREHPRDPQFMTEEEAAAPEAEVVCPIHGVVESA